jgi:cytochrome c-type biogenesis protein CcmH/NrfG
VRIDREHASKAVWVWGLIGFAVACGPSGGGKKGTALELAPPEITWQPSGEPVERAPISLTTSDGAGLSLVSLQVRTVIEEPLAFTELHMRFRNPEDRRREGRFEITLPQEAAISRFAMRIGDKMQEGEIVERKRAAQIYEDFLHRRQDPALLEKDAGNEFAARVFPIDANETKEIILSYSEEIASRNEPYRVRLQGLPSLDSFNVDVRVGSGSDQTLSLIKTDYAPTGDLEVQLPRQKPMALRNGELVVARVVPVLSLPPATVDALTVVFDTSASRALGFGAQIERLGKLVDELQARAGKDFELRVVAFDQSSEAIYKGPASGFGMREQGKLLERGALGASSFEQALSFVAQEAGALSRVLVVSDGVVTAGASDTIGLREAIAKLAAHGATRLDVLAEGGIQDRDTLRALTRSGLREAGTVLDAREPVAQLAERLLLGVQDEIEVHVSAASWVYPAVLTNVQAGDERLVFAEIPADAPVQIELKGAGAEAFDTIETPRPLLERAWSRARIAGLTAELNALRPDAHEERAAREKSIVELSIRQRVLSDYTALLVLESDGDYTRYGIKQDALSDILTVGDEGIQLSKRGGMALQIARDDVQGVREQDEEFRKEDEPEPPTTGARREQPTDDVLQRMGGRGRALNEGAPVEERAKRSTAGETSDKTARIAAPEASRPASAPMPAPASAPAEPMAPPPARAEAKPQSPAKPKADGIGSLDAANGIPIGQSAGPGLRTGSGAGMSGTKGAARDDLAIATSAPDRRLPGAIAPAPLEPAARVHGGAVEGMPADEARAALRSVSGRVKQCYARGPAPAAGTTDRLSFEISVNEKGTVSDAYVTSGSLDDRGVQNCVLTALRQVRFPKPSGPRASIAGGVELSMVPGTGGASTSQLAIATAPKKPRAVKIPTPAISDAYEGVLAEVLTMLANGNIGEAVGTAETAVAENPGDVIALVALGEALEGQRSYARAARAYGSLIDLFPSRADLRRMAGERLERLPSENLWLAVDNYARAVAQRPDHPSSHRLLAYAQLKHGQPARAFETLERALERGYRGDRFEGAERILREDLGLIGAAWLRADPSVTERVQGGLAAHGAVLDNKPSLRFVLSWETDANDVDFHIYDGRGGHAFYQKPKLASGGALYADITTGYGPECFAIPGAKRAEPYVLQAHYFARGPMGFGMGKLQVIDHAGDGNLTFAEHPFVIMKDKAFVELARTGGGAAAPSALQIAR